MWKNFCFFFNRKVVWVIARPATGLNKWNKIDAIFVHFIIVPLRNPTVEQTKKKTKTNLHRKSLMQLKTGLSFLFFLSLSEFSFWKDKIKSRKKVYKWICNIFAFDRKKKRTWSKDKSEEKEDEIKHKIEERTERASKINCKRMV